MIFFCPGPGTDPSSSPFPINSSFSDSAFLEFNWDVHSQSTIISFWAFEYSQPPKIKRWGPIAVDVCPNLEEGGTPMYLPVFQLIVSVDQIIKYLHSPSHGSCFSLAPWVLHHPPNMIMSLPDMSIVWSNHDSGGVPLTLSLDQTKVSVSSTLMSFK